MHFSNDKKDVGLSELLTQVIDVSNNWLFAGATLYSSELLYGDYVERLVEFNLRCKWQESLYDFARFGNMSSKSLTHKLIQSCTSSCALAKALLVYRAGLRDYLEPFIKSELFMQDRNDIIDTEEETGYDMTADRDKFMAYCMVMREEGYFTSDNISFNWPGSVEAGDTLGQWDLDKLSMALFFPVMNKAVLDTKGLCTKIIACANAVTTDDKPGPEAPASRDEPAADVTKQRAKLSPEQITQVVPLLFRNSQVGMSVSLEELDGKSIKEQLDMLQVTDEMEAIAKQKKLKDFSASGDHIAYSSVFTTDRCTTVLAVSKGKPAAGSSDRTGDQAKDERVVIGEVAFFSTHMMHDNLTKALSVPMKVVSRNVDNYPVAVSDLPESFGDSMTNACYATAIVQASTLVSQVDNSKDTRKSMPYVMLYRVYQHKDFSKKISANQKTPRDCDPYIQEDGTIRVITMVPQMLFINWCVLLSCISPVLIDCWVHLQVHS